MKLLLVTPECPLATALTELLKSRDRPFERLDPTLKAGAMSSVLAQHRDDMVVDLASHQALLHDDRSQFPFRRFQHLVDYCEEYGMPLLLVSDCRSFAADSERHREDTPREGTGQLAQWLQQREQYAARRLRRYVTLRLGALFSAARGDAVWRLVQRFRDGEHIALPTAAKCQPTPVEDAAWVISGIIDQLSCGAESWGAYHYASSDAADCFEFAEVALAAASQYWDLQRADPQLTADDEAACPLAGPLLNCEKIRDTFGIKQMPWRAAISTTIKQIYEAEPS